MSLVWPGFATSHKADISQLAACVHKMTVEDFAQDPHSGELKGPNAHTTPPLLPGSSLDVTTTGTCATREAHL